MRLYYQSQEAKCITHMSYPRITKHPSFSVWRVIEGVGFTFHDFELAWLASETKA